MKNRNFKKKKKKKRGREELAVFTFNKYLSTIRWPQLAHAALPPRGADAIARSNDASSSRTSSDASCGDESSRSGSGPPRLGGPERSSHI